MRNQSAYLKVCVSLCALTLSACSDSDPIVRPAVPSLPRTYSSSYAYAATIGGVEFSIDTIDMTARLRDPSTGQEVYSELTPGQAAAFAEMTATIDQGQAWYDATAVLNPLENAPPGWQPEEALPEGSDAKPASLSVRDLIELAKTKGPVSLGSLDSKNVRARVVGVVRARDRSAITSVATASRRALGPTNAAAFNDYPQYEPCRDIATSIATDRLAYLSSRNWVSDVAKSTITGQLMNIISRAGQNFVEGSDVVQAFIGVGMAGAEAKMNATALSVKTVLYNSKNCQGVIAISKPIPARIGYSGGGGTIAQCQQVYIQYEISYNGGVTWSLIEVEATLCTEDEI